MLSLLIRFIGVDECLGSSQAFIRKQIIEIRAYVDQFPHEQQDAKTLEWIERYAKSYRDNWESTYIADTVSTKRCPDCPLDANEHATQCEVHRRWLALLQQYISSQIASDQYVKETLSLLNEHKEQLKLISMKHDNLLDNLTCDGLRNCQIKK